MAYYTNSPTAGGGYAYATTPTGGPIPAAGSYPSSVQGGGAGGPVYTQVGTGAPAVLAGGRGEAPGCAQAFGPGGSCFGGQNDNSRDGQWAGSSSGPAQGAGVAPGCGTCLTDKVPNGMAYVGQNQGDYVSDTTYRYVGWGAGEFSMQTSSRCNWIRTCSMVLCLVAVLVAVSLAFLQPWATTSTMKSIIVPRAPDMKTCTFWGDPHIKTFDGERPSFYGDGEFWVVKSDRVLVQGRYMGTKYTDGLAATHKLVVAGPFINGNKIEVGSLEYGDIEVNDQPVLQTFGTSYDLPGGGVIEYNDLGELIDPAQSKYPKRVLHMRLPGDITMTVFRFKNYVDFSIVAPDLQTGWDGCCGNMNNDPADDTTEAVMSRIGARVATSDLLFSKREQVKFTVEMQQMLANTCDSDKLVEGELACRKQLPQELQIGADGIDTLNSCVFDLCFGADEHALRTAKKYDAPKKE